jgi:hypothetical protein
MSYLVGRTDTSAGAILAGLVSMAGSATLILLIGVCLTSACAPAVKATGNDPLTADQLAELWIDPGPRPRNLRTGVADDELAPVVGGRYEVVSRDVSGFSITYRVRDEHGRQWHVKIGPEAQTEVTTSRIVWAIGYHQLPSHFVERWIAVDHAKGQLIGGGRFRPHDMGLKSLGTWSWQRNPFVGSKPYNGLLVLMMVLNSTDLKNENNEEYEIAGEAREGARRWYVVKDLGASLGETGRMDPRRGYVEGFEREPFITGVSDGRVTFGFRGRHQELLDHIGVDDVRWTCERLRRLTDNQWKDAFGAGGFTAEQTARFVARIKQKIDEGLALR